MKLTKDHKKNQEEWVTIAARVNKDKWRYLKRKEYNISAIVQTAIDEAYRQAQKLEESVEIVKI